MLTRTPLDDLGVPHAARLADTLTLLLWQAAEHDEGGFRPFIGRTPLPRPYGTIRLEPSSGLRAALMHLPRRAAADQLVRLGAGARSAPAFSLDSVAADPDALIEGLAEAAQARLLGFLLELGAGLFRAGRSPGLLRACRKLAARLHESACAVAPHLACTAAVLPGGMQLLAVPAGGPPGAWHLLGGEEVRRLASATVDGQTHLLARHAAAGDTLHPGGGARPWKIAAPAGAVPHLLGWIETASRPAAAAVVELIRAASDAPGEGADLLRPLLRDLAFVLPQPTRVLDGTQQPVAGALELAVPDHQGGLFLRGWLRDPHGLVRTTRLRLPWGEMVLPDAAMARLPRGDLAARFARSMHRAAPPSGFVAHLGDIGGTTHQPTLVLELASGAEIQLTPPLRSFEPAAARDLVLSSVPPTAITETIMAAAIAPAAARLHAAAMGAARSPEVIRIGKPPARPALSVLIPVYRTLSFLRAQVAAFACDPAWAEVETILILDSPEQKAELEHLLRGLSLMHGLALTLVVMPRNLGYAAANNAGAAVARARLLLLLNSDVVPDAAGWLSPLIAVMDDRRVGAAGPKLLFEDGSIQHAGLFFRRDADGTWFNQHYFKGYPRRFPSACTPRSVPAVTGAALLVRRALFDKAGGITEDYIIGDYEDSDFCLKLRRAGSVIRFVPQSELWHFERRSISAHAGYARGLASLYNRRLHHARWDATIGQLMGAAGRGARA